MKGIIWLRIAVVYFVIGVIFGMYIGMNKQFQLTSVHAHVNLLGWVSLALAGVIYCLFPAASQSRLGKMHFWLHNIGLPVIIIGLYLELAPIVATPLIPIGGTIAILGIVLFMANLFVNVKEETLFASGKAKNKLPL